MLNSDMEHIYTSYFLRVLSYFRRRVPVLMDAEDLTADTFVYVFTHIDQYNRDKSPLSAWIFLIASSRLKNYYRDRKNNISLDSGEEGKTVDIPIEDMADNIIELMSIRKMVYSALLKLPEMDRKIIIYRHFLNKKGDEIAKKMNTTPGNVRVITFRALQKMRRYLADQDENM